MIRRLSTLVVCLVSLVPLVSLADNPNPTTPKSDPNQQSTASVQSVTEPGNPPAGFPVNPMKTLQPLMAQQRYAEAIKEANRYLDMDSHNGEVLFIKAQALTQLKKVDEAISVLENLTEVAPEMATPYNNLAVLYAQKGRLNDARKMLEMAVQIQPNYATALENLGDIYLTKAKEAYTKAQKENPKSKSLKQKITTLSNLE
ncbi:tetratricopeptide repeat protein [Ferrovum sp. PN-J185]|uniref:tetratricopeptide repeat protein n=1 Tax=Ferrovum sp. PN-J185 TaxID=1356306 RepID=UPI0007983DA0|nr:tetratricopeptide repeat protein [Ferrovum sp. PN-J185]KXW55761.1 beta-barrel assembly-enhancing protease [Ferrovum sp. PN-J185]MCC6068541.1 tetratricopeptide repeat protein [Ferrovum sp. PN-J185]MDE1892146.1 tetratricopeptide repeat protein [Betaproteobacteria bacterium]